MLMRAFCLSLIVWIACSSPATSATRHVVVLYDERTSLPGLAAISARIARTLASASPDVVQIYEESMDLSRFDPSAQMQIFREYLTAKYASKKIDVIIAVLGPSLEFLVKHGDEIFPGVPVVFCGVDARELGKRTLPPHFTGVFLKREFSPTVDLVLQLQPDARQFVVVAGTSDFDAELLAQFKEEVRSYENRFNFRYLTTLPMSDLLKELSHLPPNTVVLYTTLFRDGAGEAFVPHEVVERISTAANAPVFGFLDQLLGQGIVGGKLYSLAPQGSEAARLALQILGGAEPSRLPALTVGATELLFDWRQLRRWGIDEARLPSGSEMRFREFSLWEQYFWEILLAGMIIVLQAALIGVLLYEHRRRRVAEVESSQRMAQLAHLNRQTTAGQLSASIAHELNQPLGAILSNTEAVELMLDSPVPNMEEIKAILADIKRNDQRASDVIQRLRRLLTKAQVEARNVDLNEIVREVVAILAAQAAAQNVALRAVLTPHPLVVKADRVQMEQVILNLVANAMDVLVEAPRSNRRIDVRVHLLNDDTVELSVSDRGPGMPPDILKQIFEPFFTTKNGGMGMGLAIARTIIETHGGRLWAENRAGGGAILRLTLPVIPLGAQQTSEHAAQAST